MKELFDIALAFVRAKFPEEFHNPKYKFDVFDLVEMTYNELMNVLISLGEAKDVN